MSGRHPDTRIGPDPALAEVDVDARNDLDAFAKCPRHLSVVKCSVNFGASSKVLSSKRLVL